MTFAHATYASPVGELTMIASDQGLAAILWPDDDLARVRLERGAEARNHPLLRRVADQLEEYFAGRRIRFDLPLLFHGTEFQKAVWAALMRIPFGETRSYADIARAIGRPSACRAVGAANGRNPLSIIAPCHRVVGTNGKLTGFAGGLKVKRYLLDHERKIARTGRQWCTQVGFASSFGSMSYAG